MTLVGGTFVALILAHVVLCVILVRRRRRFLRTPDRGERCYVPMRLDRDTEDAP